MEISIPYSAIPSPSAIKMITLPNAFGSSLVKRRSPRSRIADSDTAADTGKTGRRCSADIRHAVSARADSSTASPEAAFAMNGQTMQTANTKPKEASCMKVALFLLLPRDNDLTAMSTDAIKNTTGKVTIRKIKNRHN